MLDGPEKRMTDYEIEFQQNSAACGEPFSEMVTFFEDYTVTSARVLDLGCGQGRDASMIASHGHRVHGVDISVTGIDQMIEQSREAGTGITGEVADIRQYEPSGEYDVVLLDRVIHMLDTPAEKDDLLAKAQRATAVGGYVLIADIPSDMEIIETTFEPLTEWELIFRRKGFRFYRRPSNQANSADARSRAAD